jgi:membrane associated rhomboid family serine protease
VTMASENQLGGESTISEPLGFGWNVPAHAYTVPFYLTALMVALWLFSAPGGGMQGWAASWPEVAHGHLMTLWMHIFAHGGFLHISMNTVALLVLGPPLVARLGPPPTAWLRFFTFFLLSGLSGATLFLLCHTDGSASMLGASGAIFGILGALSRFKPSTGDLVAIRSRGTLLLAKAFLRDHALLFAALAAVAFVTGASIGIAWQAHLGGLLFGLFGAPLFVHSALSADKGRESTPAYG